MNLSNPLARISLVNYIKKSFTSEFRQPIKGDFWHMRDACMQEIISDFIKVTPGLNISLLTLIFFLVLTA